MNNQETLNITFASNNNASTFPINQNISTAQDMHNFPMISSIPSNQKKPTASTSPYTLGVHNFLSGQNTSIPQNPNLSTEIPNSQIIQNAINLNPENAQNNENFQIPQIPVNLNVQNLTKEELKTEINTVLRRMKFFDDYIRIFHIIITRALEIRNGDTLTLLELYAQYSR